MTIGYQARVCECSHTEGEHNMGRPHGSRPARGGVCLVQGCGCRVFVEDVEGRFEREQMAAWLTDIPDSAA